jgi:hypothetical protein
MSNHGVLLTTSFQITLQVDKEASNLLSVLGRKLPVLYTLNHRGGFYPAYCLPEVTAMDGNT